MPTTPEILNAETRLSADHAATFSSNPVKTFYRQDTRLYRFVTLSQNYVFGPYWVDRDTMSEMIGLAKGDDEALTRIARSMSAVKEVWNRQMHYIAEISLRQACYGWEGRSRYQTSSETPGLIYFGHGKQVFLPGLSEEYARVVTFTQVGRV